MANQSLAVINKTILQKLKASNISMMIHLTLYLSTSHIALRSQMLCTNGLFDMPRANFFEATRSMQYVSNNYLPWKNIFMLKQKSSNLYIICFHSVRKFLIVYPRCIGNRWQWNATWGDSQPHGYSTPIFIPHLGETRPSSTMTAGKRMFLWNALLTTLYVKPHDKCLFLLASDL